MRWSSLVVVFVLVSGCSQPSNEETREPTVDFEELALQATATTGVIRGLVVDETIRPIGNVSILLTPGDQQTVSTAAGTFGFEGLKPGTYFLRVSHLRYLPTQTSVEVVAGVSEPPITKVLLVADPSARVPYVDALSFNGFLSLGAAVILTSVGTTVFGPLADSIGDTSIWTVNFTMEPMWLQGELVWQHNQPAGGMLIWEITRAGSNTPEGYRETTESPALAYWDNETVEANNATNWEEHEDYDDVGEWDLVEDGVSYRFFGGPHPLCTGVGFGCGLTVQQRADAYIHNFYNFAPPEGWRFTVDGDPVVPG